MIQLGWHVACSSSMKKTLVAIVLVSIVGGPASAERPRLGGPEAPRATDLLRAETMAEQAEKRLQVPHRKGPGWLRGGSGWDEDTGASPAPRDSVIINVHPSRRRPPRP